MTWCSEWTFWPDFKISSIPFTDPFLKPKSFGSFAPSAPSFDFRMPTPRLVYSASVVGVSIPRSISRSAWPSWPTTSIIAVSLPVAVRNFESRRLPGPLRSPCEVMSVMLGADFSPLFYPPCNEFKCGLSIVTLILLLWLLSSPLPLPPMPLPFNRLPALILTPSLPEPVTVVYLYPTLLLLSVT